MCCVQEGEILPYMPLVITNLLAAPDARELYDFLPLLNQLIMKFKVSEELYILDIKNFLRFILGF